MCHIGVHCNTILYELSRSSVLQCTPISHVTNAHSSSAAVLLFYENHNRLPPTINAYLNIKWMAEFYDGWCIMMKLNVMCAYCFSGPVES